MNKIVAFRDEHRWLSNMVECEIKYGDLIFKSTEAFYQAMKTKDKNVRVLFTGYDGPTSKKEGRKLSLRDDWELVKDDVMEFALSKKFSKEPFKSLLLSTGDVDIIEGNYWHDNYFGSCTCAKCGNKGLNKLGKMIMAIRENLRSSC